MLLADVMDPLSGGAGWVGAGLLGLVLAWLMLKHLPDKDKQIKELIDSKDKQIVSLTESKDQQISTLLDKKWTAIETMATKFSAALKDSMEHCEIEIDKMTAAFKYELDRLFTLIRSDDDEISSPGGKFRGQRGQDPSTGKPS